MNKKSKNSKSSLIAQNRKAKHDYLIEESLEAGIELQGWEVKSLRAGKIQIRDAYISIRDYEVNSIGLLINPLPSASTHVDANPTRSRKLLLKKKEIDKLRGAIERKGLTGLILSLYWKKNLVKAEIAIAKGKKVYDKRNAEKQRDWEREKARLKKSKF